MYSDSDLDSAVAAGAISAEAVAGFRAFIDHQRQTPVADEEQFRLLTGFNDIFVSIAIVLLLIALATLGNILAHSLGAAAIAVISWPLAEYFTRKQRMALPSIILLLSFVGGIFATGFENLPEPRFTAGHGNSLLLAGCAAITAAAAYLHWWRFKVPITIAAGACAALGTVLVLLIGQIELLREHWIIPVFIGGLAVFTLAMRWDMSDRERRTRRSDVAFWLHLAAAPLIVHPAFAALGLGAVAAELSRAGAAIAIYLVLALVALAVDRRALLVSALAYVLYAISVLFQAAGSLNASFALTALVIGSALLLLSAFWHRARVAVVRVLPLGLTARLPAL